MIREPSSVKSAGWAGPVGHALVKPRPSCRTTRATSSIQRATLAADSAVDFNELIIYLSGKSMSPRLKARVLVDGRQVAARISSISAGLDFPGTRGLAEQVGSIVTRPFVGAVSALHIQSEFDLVWDGREPHFGEVASAVFQWCHAVVSAELVGEMTLVVEAGLVRDGRQW